VLSVRFSSWGSVRLLIAALSSAASTRTTSTTTRTMSECDASITMPHCDATRASSYDIMGHEAAIVSSW